MRLSHLPLVALLAVASLAGGVRAETFIVDQAGGPGTDFLDVQSAINVAQHGDLIIVRPGTYPGFDLSLGLTILGSEASDTSVIGGPVTITNIPNPQRAVLTGLRMQETTVAMNPGHVILDSLRIDPQISNGATVSIVDCADVRLYQTTVRALGGGSPAAHAVQVVDSRFEAIECEFLGAGGYGTGCGGTAGDGGDGLWVSQGSLIALFQTTCIGGAGGDGEGFCEWTDSYGGDGGDGLFLRGGSSAVVAGTSANELKHGREGYGDCFPWPCSDGSPGKGLVVNGSSAVRYSGVTVSSQQVQMGSSIVHAVPDDPFLERVGTLQAGRLQTFWVDGTPGDAVTLFLGRSPAITVDPLQEMDNLVSHERSYNLGVIPPAGRAQFSFVLPNSFPTGFHFYAQAETVPPGGQARLTNSLPVVIRHMP